MIRIRKKINSPVPDILTTKGKLACEALKQRYKDGEREFKSEDFDSKIYGHATVKHALIAIQNGKCCFCESKFEHVSFGDVEHFRPKAGWVQLDEAINKPGYYWLAYDWDNLLVCCQICNQRYKKNFFPISGTGVRALSHLDDVASERPVFIHPVNDEPESFIAFNQEVLFAIDENERGKETIGKLRLDRNTLNEQRLRILNRLAEIYKIAKGIPETLPELKNMANGMVVGYYSDSLLDSTEYASMLRCFFAVNPIDF